MVLDPNDIVPAATLLESFVHPKYGWLDFDPRTGVIQQPPQKKPIAWPIGIPEKLAGTKQPHIPTCSYPGEGNKGCPKAQECPILRAIGQDRPHIGPLAVIAQNRDAISSFDCYDYFSAHDLRGKTIYQTNHYEHGWKLATNRTSIPVRSANPQFNASGAKTHNSPVDWELEIQGLAPYWWPLLKKKGLPLPEVSKRFPELVGEDECTTQPSPEYSPSASPSGRKKRISSQPESRATGSRKRRSAPPSSPTGSPDA